MILKISESDKGFTVKIQLEIYDATALLTSEDLPSEMQTGNIEYELLDQLIGQVRNRLPQMLHQVRQSIEESLAKIVFDSYRNLMPNVES
jgi:hypothetical protein